MDFIKSITNFITTKIAKINGHFKSYELKVKNNQVSIFEKLCYFILKTCIAFVSMAMVMVIVATFTYLMLDYTVHFVLTLLFILIIVSGFSLYNVFYKNNENSDEIE